MTNTLRLFKNQDTDTLKTTATDFSDYREQLAHDRNSRTLTLRRIKKPTIAQFLNQGQKNPLNSPLIDINNFPFLDINYAITQLNNGNTTSLSEFLNSLTVCATTTPRLASNLAQTPELADPFVEALQAQYGDQVTIQLIRAMIAIYPISGENMIRFVDSGLTSCFYDFLTSESLPLLEAAIQLVGVMADYSSYANDSLLCIGIHQFLIDIAKEEHNEEITLQALDVLKRIFSLSINLSSEKKHKIDVSTLTYSFDKMEPLLSLSSLQALNSALMCFVAMTDQFTGLVYNIYEKKLFPKIVGFLKVPELVSAALPLIGNMSVCNNATHVDALLDLGLFDLLVQLLDTEYIADVYWVLSNLVESYPQKTVNLFNQDFIEQTIDVAMRSSAEVKREATFFLATLSVYIANEDLSYFMNENVLELMFEMLNFSITFVVLRCLGSLIRFAQSMQVRDPPPGFAEMFHGEEFLSILNNLVENSDVIDIQDFAQYLLDLIDGGSPSPLAC